MCQALQSSHGICEAFSISQPMVLECTGAVITDANLTHGSAVSWRLMDMSRPDGLCDIEAVTSAHVAGSTLQIAYRSRSISSKRPEVVNQKIRVRGEQVLGTQGLATWRGRYVSMFILDTSVRAQFARHIGGFGPILCS